jgi:small subunit ribosomal protein S18
MVSEYMTPMGRIKHSNETGLRPVNQRRIARTIRRTIGMGIMPSVHRHPEILMKIVTRMQRSGTGSRASI